jgi:hypothetical protein
VKYFLSRSFSLKHQITNAALWERTASPISQIKFGHVTCFCWRMNISIIAFAVMATVTILFLAATVLIEWKSRSRPKPRNLISQPSGFNPLL